MLCYRIFVTILKIFFLSWIHHVYLDIIMLFFVRQGVIDCKFLLLVCYVGNPVSFVLSCRHSLLGSLLRDSTAIHLHDIQYTVVGNDEVEPSVLERRVYPGTMNNITSFSWHPTHENRMLTIALSGTITDYVVFERITLNWSPRSHVVWTHGRRTLKVISEKNTVYTSLSDISVKLKRRALNDYGLKVSTTCLSV